MGDQAKKITANIPAKLLLRAQQLTGLGITETLVAGLEELERSKQRSALERARAQGCVAAARGVPLAHATRAAVE